MRLSSIVPIAALAFFGLTPTNAEADVLHPSGMIRIVAGTYGHNCGVRRGNKTGHLRRHCQGRNTCVYTVDYRVIGDPRQGCSKNYLAEWRCGGNPYVHRRFVVPEAGYRKRVTLVCNPRPTPPRPGHTGQGRAQAHLLVRRMPKRASTHFKHRADRRYRMQTQRHDRVPYSMRNPGARTIVIQPGQRAFLAGNRQGNARISVDNFLVVSIASRGRVQRYVVGATEPVSFRGRRLPRIGRNTFHFRGGEINLTRYIPKGVPTRIEITAMDYGVVGHVSDVYLVIR